MGYSTERRKASVDEGVEPPHQLDLAMTDYYGSVHNAETIMIDVQLVSHPVSAEPLDKSPDDCGGECMFLGRTRRDQHPQLGALQRLSYDAYEGMALRVLQALAEQAVREFGCRVVRVHHALGEVPVGSASVLVQVACGHRDQAFEACRFLIDHLKADAPIWKREVWERGSTWSQAVSDVAACTNSPGMEG